MAYGERGDLTTPAEQERVGANNEPVCPDFDQGCERCFSVLASITSTRTPRARAAACTCLCTRLRERACLVHEKPNDHGFRHHFPQQLHALWHQIDGKSADACEICPGRLRLATRPYVTGSATKLLTMGIVVSLSWPQLRCRCPQG